MSQQFATQVIDYLARLGIPWRQVVAGCEECAPTMRVLASVIVPARILYLLRWMTGDPLIPRGWYRCEECNRRRGGSARSRHLEGAAFDVDPQDPRAFYRTLLRWGDGSWETLADRLAAWSGAQALGWIVYESGALHVDTGCLPGGEVCDPRSRHYIDIGGSWGL